MHALSFASELIKFDTVSSKSNLEASDYIERQLQSLEFDTETVPYERDGVIKVNVIARKGHGTGGIAYFGHTDVVPVDDWSIDDHGPFEPTVCGSRLYGRGSTDMKGSIACMLSAVVSLKDQNQQRPMFVCCSADEELDHRGINEVVNRSEIYRELVVAKACGIVGEATGMNVVYAHKGGVQIVVKSQGKAAHSSTHEGVNANWAMIPFLQEMKKIHDETRHDLKSSDNEFDPPSICLNIGINDHTKAVNITAPQSICTLCFRPMPNTNVDSIIHRIQTSAETFGLQFEISGRNPAFWRDPTGPFSTACTRICGGVAPSTVAYGSEAGNLTEVEQLIVLGPGDISQAHKSDEWISLQQLENGTEKYQQILKQFCY